MKINVHKFWQAMVLVSMFIWTFVYAAGFILYVIAKTVGTIIFWAVDWLIIAEGMR
jgi:hypothetical protein